MDATNCENCGAPDQSTTTECKYCGHQPTVQADPVQPTAKASTPENVVQVQGEISHFKLLLTSLLVGWAVMALTRMMMGG
ncbi:MAG: hypothetical protein FWF59_07340 [Turicibacter sp.]|nr:hypothetical protein [Turicibacter sp.]